MSKKTDSQLPLGEPQKNASANRPPAHEEPERYQPRVEVLEPQAMVRLGISDQDEIEQELSLIQRLTALEDAAALFERRTALIAQARRASIAATNPDDWVLFRDKQGNVTGMLCRSGADKVADYYGIQVTNFRPLKDGIFQPLIEKKGEEIRYYGWCDAFSTVTGRRIESIEFGRSSSEDFTGRGAITTTSQLVAMADLRAATFTCARTKAVRIVCSMARVPEQELEDAWAGTDKNIDQCRKGSGFGTSTDRSAGKVTDAEVKQKAKELGDEILRRVGGDTSAAADLLKECTANPPKFGGFDSVARLTQGWQVENAWKALREHSHFGDQATGGK